MLDFDIKNRVHRLLAGGIALIFAGGFAAQFQLGLIIAYALAFSGYFLVVLACIEVRSE